MSEIQVLAGLGFYTVYFPWLMDGGLPVFTRPSFCVYVCVLISSYKDTHHVALGLTLMNSF